MGRGGARLGALKEEENRAKKKQGKDLDERNLAEKHCQPIACQLQSCVNRNTYRQELCKDLIKSYKECKDEYLSDKTQTDK